MNLRKFVIKEKLVEAYKAQIKHFEEREKELKADLEVINPSKKKKFRF